MIQLLQLLQISDELFVVHRMLCSRLDDRQQQQPSTDVSFVDGHLSNYQTLVNSCIDSVIKVHVASARAFTLPVDRRRVIVVGRLRFFIPVWVRLRETVTVVVTKSTALIGSSSRVTPTDLGPKITKIKITVTKNNNNKIVRHGCEQRCSPEGSIKVTVYAFTSIYVQLIFARWQHPVMDSLYYHACQYSKRSDDTVL